MIRIVVCSVALIAVIAGVRWLMATSIENLGLGWGALIGAVILAPFLIFAWLYDRANTRRQEVLPPAPRDFQ